MRTSLSTLLLELRNVAGEGPPSSSKYFARPIGDGYVLYYDVSDNGGPQVIPGTVAEFYDSTYVRGAKSAIGSEFKFTPEQLAKAEELVSMGLYEKREEKTRYPDIEFDSRNKPPGSPSSQWKSVADVPGTYFTYSPKGQKFDFLLVDTDKKLVSLDTSWKGINTRRGGSTPTKSSNKSYVMPSGDVDFTSSTLALQKLFDHLMSVDPRVTAGFRIISPDDKFEGKTIGVVADEPRSIDVAVGGAPGKLVVYHGTSTKRWPEIEKKGMLPGKFEEGYVDQIKGYSEKNLYFTMDPHTAENYATRAAIWDKAAALILQVEIPDITKIVPDEDAMGRFSLSREYTLKLTPGERTNYAGKWDTVTNNYPKEEYEREDITISGEQNIKGIFQFLKSANQTKAYGKTEVEAPQAGSEYVKNDEYHALLKEIEQKMAGFLTKSLRGETFAYRGWIPPKFVKKWKEYPRQAYPRAVDNGGGTGDEYEETRQKVLKKVKRFGMNENGIRQIVREILAEETVGIPGYGMTGKEFEDRVGVKAVYDGRTGKVKPDEVKFVAQQLRMARPDRIVAYSRGAPVYNNAVMDPEMAGVDVPVTFMAPSSYRKWSNAPVKRAAPGSVTMIGDKDKVVPYKQACRNAVDAGTPMYIMPGFSHTGILYSKAQVTPDSFEVDAPACLTDPEMPDWGPSRNGSDEEIIQQKERVRMHLKHETILRNLIRSML